jgi:hypothetical protein
MKRLDYNNAMFSLDLCRTQLERSPNRDKPTGLQIIIALRRSVQFYLSVGMRVYVDL